MGLPYSPGAVVNDTRKPGKPDIIKLTHHLVDEFKPERVCHFTPEADIEGYYGLRNEEMLAIGADSTFRGNSQTYF